MLEKFQSLYTDYQVFFEDATGFSQICTLGLNLKKKILTVQASGLQFESLLNFKPCCHIYNFLQIFKNVAFFFYNNYIICGLKFVGASIFVNFQESRIVFFKQIHNVWAQIFRGLNLRNAEIAPTVSIFVFVLWIFCLELKKILCGKTYLNFDF
eukprot:TRINITY_DN5294_c0_g2_i8.p2 TRINITY_DN5294_c0_g2~~TRINITY_DN5294_c0_g2_i8.p2  ORF type:complete len:154 (-),score=4.04 TRINITY_DN5294_c0_g2_i8:641-1102(-)